ncbi:MAG: hypothetical protein ACM3U2_03210 [Deltaproteobacteria bacterium]
MTSKGIRRTVMLLLFVGGPLVGYLINDHRGAMFGLAVSVLAVIWYFLEERRIV